MGRTTSLGTSPSAEARQFSRDTVLEVLSNRRRRFVIHHLKRTGEGDVTLYDLSERVAAWENDKPREDLSYEERKRVQNALRQFHLPKMADARIVEFDRRRGTVALTEAASACNFYVDVVPERGIPWSVYYLGLSGVAVLGLAGLLLGVPPLTGLPPVAWGVSLVAILVVSSLAQFYDSYYRMRLGTRTSPPEVDQ